jgi:glycosyltransferase involved in cell wall biosynthesis
VAPRTASALPTLAEDLASRSPGNGAPGAPLVVVFESSVVEQAASLQVGGSTRVTLAGHTLDELLEVVRTNEGDVLLVSDARPLADGAVARLMGALELDSACATVSVDEDAAPASPGLPPPGALGPRRGVLLVRRAHLVLAADEADLTRGFAAAPTDHGGGVVGELLALVDRPGFVHRAVGAPTAVPPVDPTTQVPATRRGKPPRIAVDGRCLAYARSGTQVQLLGLLGGLARAGADVSVLAPPELHPTVQPEVARLADAMPFVERSALGRPEVFHRPFQVGSVDVLADCLTVGERFVLTHQDMILDRTRAYHLDLGAWHDYREATRASLCSADAVGFFSRHAAVDAASDGLVELDRATVVPLGVDHLAGRDMSGAPAEPLGGRPFLLVVGSTLWHKNRPFALRLLARLVERQGWDGGLVLAGGHATRGSSVDAERVLLGRIASLDGRVVDLGHISDGEQLALYRAAELVLFPSLYEGFGFIPFEAAACGTACVYTGRAAMGELLPTDGALESFELDEAAGLVAGLLASRDDRARIVERIGRAAAPLTWDATAAGYLEVYERAVAMAPTRISRSLVAKIPQPEAVLGSRAEVVLVDVYRRRRAFRALVDAGIGAGQLGARALRRLSRGRGSARAS